MKPVWWWLVTTVVLAGCVERLTTPGQCPELCPGEQLVVLDTTIAALAASDSAFFGYVPRINRRALLVSNSLPAGEARSFVVFPGLRTDSIMISGDLVELVVDTVRIELTLFGRDSTATDLVVYLHRVPVTTDTTVDFQTLDGLLSPASIFDSIMVPDSLPFGLIETILTDERVDLIQTAPEDSMRVGIGLTVGASKPTGVRLGIDLLQSASAPLLEVRGRVDVADTARQRQTVGVRPSDLAGTGYVLDRDAATNADPDLLYVGGPSGARSMIRFALPSALDSAQVIRATLEVTPAVPLLGLPNNPAGDSLGVIGVVADLGAKSPPLVSFGRLLLGGLNEGTTDVVSVDLLPLLGQWQAENGPPATVFLSQRAEGSSFMQPVFFSTRSPSGQPRLRVTYALPTRPGRP